MKRILILSIIPLFVFSCHKDLQHSKPSFLLSVINDENGDCAFVNSKGDTIITYGKYQMCFTDTFRTCAIVLNQNSFVGIDRNEKVLFEVFMHDNGPDYVSEGLFRIKEKGKIGYANLAGEIIISPQFGCAYPFENAKAKVSLSCNESQDGEHSLWQSDQWFYIDKNGNRLD